MPNLWSREPECYQGLQEKASPGTHSACQQLVERHVQTRHSYLDLATGNGALAKRLADLGFQQVLGVELDPDSVQWRELAVRKLDLNLNFAQHFAERFDLISAVEIIEHLDNPRHFLNETKRLLKPKGHILLTTPNIQQIFSRITFLLKGEFRHFTRSDYFSQRHITPLSDTQLRDIFAELRLKIIDTANPGLPWGSLKNALYTPIAACRHLFGGFNGYGEVNAYLLQGE